MKNLKKLNRAEQKEINGGALKGCTTHSQCFGAWCCNRICVPMACIED